MADGWDLEHLVGDLVNDGGSTWSYMPVILASAVVWAAIIPLSRVISPLIATKSYLALDPSKKFQWDVRVVSTCFSIVITLSVIPNLFDPVLHANPVWAYKHEASLAYATATGYFLYDIILCIFYFAEYGPAFMAHAVSCFFVYLFTLRPFLTFYGSVFLMFEVSTIFLNISWFLDKSGLSGSPVQIINGVLLVLNFFAFRIVFGLLQSFYFFNSLRTEYDQIPKALFVFYSVSNVLLNGLNLFWFVKMIQMFIKRLTPRKEKKI